MGVVFTPLAALALALLAHALGEQAMAPEGHEGAFEAWMRRYHKSYATVEQQEAHFATFKRNYDIVKAGNKQGRSFQLELNAFADKTSEEFAHGMGLMATKRRPLRDSVRFIRSHRPRNVTLPTSVDWRKQGAVTPVKNQGTCGACWAFSTIATLESAWSIATLGAGKQQLLSLSEQQLVDCAKTDSGCEGGNPSMTFGFTEKSNICTEGSYPYKGADSACGNSDCMVGIMVGNIKGFVDVSPDQQTLMDAIAQQPVTASIQAGGATNPFQLYKSGVLSENCSGEVDHSVTIIGYGTEGNQPYWLVRNSWGADWGENGYARLLRGQPGEAGECMIRSDNAYPEVDATHINDWMNGTLPLGTVMGLVLGGIVVLVFGGWFVMRQIQKRRSVSWNGTTSRPLVAPSSTSLQATTRPIPIPATVVTPASISSAPQASGPKGNSAKSRLL